MKKILVPAAAAALLALTPLASMARNFGDYTSATVQSLNAATRSVTLTDGSTFKIGYASLADQLQPGAHVALHWQDVNGDFVITKVAAAS